MVGITISMHYTLRNTDRALQLSRFCDGVDLCQETNSEHEGNLRNLTN